MLSLYSEKTKLIDVNTVSKIIRKCEDSQAEVKLIKARLDSGRKIYVLNGKKVGRKCGYKKSLETYYKDYSELIELIKTTNMSLRKLADMCNVSINTVRRVKKIIEMENSCYDKREAV